MIKVEAINESDSYECVARAYGLWMSITCVTLKIFRPSVMKGIDKPYRHVKIDSLNHNM